MSFPKAPVFNKCRTGLKSRHDANVSLYGSFECHFRLCTSGEFLRWAGRAGGWRELPQQVKQEKWWQGEDPEETKETSDKIRHSPDPHKKINNKIYMHICICAERHQLNTAWGVWMISGVKNWVFIRLALVISVTCNQGATPRTTPPHTHT